jgi:hypothetical protein
MFFCSAVRRRNNVSHTSVFRTTLAAVIIATLISSVAGMSWDHHVPAVQAAQVPGPGGPCMLPAPGLPAVSIVPPAADLDPLNAALSGAWEGTWSGGPNASRLIVEEIKAGGATVIYSFTDLGNVREATRRTWRVARPGTIVLEGGVRFAFTLSPDLQSLEGERVAQGNVSRVTMRRCSLSAGGATTSSEPAAPADIPLCMLSVPVLDGVAIAQPAAGLSPGVAAYSGAWEGRWSGAQNTSRLIVESIDSTTATVIYSFASGPSRVVERLPATIGTSGELTFRLGAGTFTFSISPDRTSIDGSLTVGDRVTSRVTMRRCALTAAATASGASGAPPASEPAPTMPADPAMVVPMDPPQAMSAATVGPSESEACPTTAAEAASFLGRPEVTDYLSPAPDMQHGWRYSGPATSFAVTAAIVQIDFDGGSATADTTPEGTAFTIWLRCGGNT